MRYIEKFIAKLKKIPKKIFMKTRLHIFIILSLFISPFAIYGADAFLFMGTGNSGNPANLSDRSQWTYLSTYDSGGDDWNFRVFPVGTDDRIPTDKGDYASGAIGADQSQQITSSSTVLLKRWVMGEPQSDGSVSFGTTVTEATTFKFTESFTAGTMNARINNLMTIQFEDAENIDLNLSSLTLYQIAHMYLKKTTAGSVNINVGGTITIAPPRNQGGVNLDLGAYDGFIDSISAGTLNIRDVLDISVNMYAYSTDFASTVMTNTNGDLKMTLNVGKLKTDGTAIYSFGTTTKNDTEVITVDFGMLNTDEISAGEYKIFWADEWSKGFADAGSLEDFDLRTDILDAYGINYDIAWDGQNLILTVVPEPSMVAAALGLLAFAVAAVRRRK